MKTVRRIVGAACVAALEWSVSAGGLMLPSDPALAPLALKYHRVSVEIHDLVATTTVKQAFRNSTGRRLEATYVFPLPRDATLSEFIMIVDGREVHGEILEHGKAVRIYEDIVRRLRDPGLLEYMGNRLFRARVYPIPPHGLQKIEIRYSQVIRKDSGVCRYVYPLRTGERASRTLDDLTVRVHIQSKEPIKTIYSPTHRIDAVRKSEHEAVAGFEGVRERLDRDFELIWTVSEKELGINLLAHRRKGEDGYFILMLSPPVEVKEKDIQPKDVVFVLDTSGSMRQGNKMTKARAALKFCIRSLRRDDRFNIVRFSTDVDTVYPELTPAAPENVEKACRTIDSYQPRGGTDICNALLTALSMCPEKDRTRPFFVVFLTDGRPTVGVTIPEQILDKVLARNRASVRIFCFGVGYDVNAPLLDSIADKTRAFSVYVRPEEDIELKVSMLFDKVGTPLLIGPELEIKGVHVFDLYPKHLPDVFRGSRILVFGRYRRPGHAAVRITGQTAKGKRTFTYEAVFPGENVDNEFIPKLWATRKVGYLLDQIRLHGETPELREEVVRLSKEYGIMTPYTAFLIVPDEAPVARAVSPPRRLPGGPVPLGVRKARSAPAPAGEVALPMFAEGAGLAGGHARRTLAPVTPAAAPGGFTARTGKAAVDASMLVSRLRSAATRDETQESSKVRAVGGKVFVLRDSVWTDTKYVSTSSMRTIRVRYASPAWFELWRKRSDLRPWLKLGDRLIVVLDDKLVLRVDEDGLDELTEEARRLLLP